MNLCRFLMCSALLTLSVGTAVAQQTVQAPLGALIRGVSGDGSRAIGNQGGEAFYWDWRVDPTPTLIGGQAANAVSYDGSVIVGNMEDPVTGDSIAGRWTVATGWVALGGMSNCGSISSARDVSDDGTAVTGLAWDGCSAIAFLWTTTGGFEQLQVLGAGSHTANTISGDGSMVGGYATGTTGRTPATWETGNLNGQVFDADIQGEVKGMTGNGEVTVGSRYFSGGTLTAYVHNSASGFVNLGSLDPAWSSTALDVSESGAVIIGNDSLLLSRKAWIWRVGVGLESLHDALIDIGIHPGDELYESAGLSDDGKVLVGNSGFNGLSNRGFVSELSPQDLTWEDLGGDTNGINGHPHLSGTGTLVSGAPTTIDLVNGPTSAISVVWVSITSVPFPVAGGVIHANPFVSEILIPLNPAGEFHAAFPWFAGVPSGFELYFQFIIQDLSRVYGYSLSNGLKATAP